jgi:hypothetical protein
MRHHCPILLLFGFTLLLPAQAPAQTDADAGKTVKELSKIRTRHEAERFAAVLVELGPRSSAVLPDLVRLLDDTNYFTTVGAELALKQLGRNAAPVASQMRQRAKDADDFRRAQSLSILKVIDPEGSRQLFEDLVLHDSSDRVRRSALEPITDNSVLAEMIRGEKDGSLKMAALNKISDQTVLAELAKSIDDLTLRAAVIDKITERVVLLNLVASGPSSIRRDALQRLPSFVVSDIAAKHSDPAVRRDAVWLLDDAFDLGRISQKDSDTLVREAAKLSFRGNKSDLTVDGIDCKPDKSAKGNDYLCYIRLVNRGVVAYTNLTYILGETAFSTLNAKGEPKYLEGKIEPGETKEYRLGYKRSSEYNQHIQFRLVGSVKAAPASP